VILVIDSRDKEKISESADYLFDVISDIDFAMSGIPILVCCNKNDLTFSRRAT